jgi:hypothetical protein
MFFLNRERKDPKAVRAVIGQYINFFFLITYLVLPSVTTTCFGAFTCKSIDPDGLMPGTPTYLRLDMSIACNTPRYRFGVYWAIVMIIIYPIGILSSYYFVLRYNRDDIIAAHLVSDVEGKEKEGEGESEEAEGEAKGANLLSAPAPAEKGGVGGQGTVAADRPKGVGEGQGEGEGEDESGFEAPPRGELDDEGWQADLTVTRQRVRWDQVRIEGDPEEEERHARQLARRAAGDPEVENREDLDFE